MMSHQAGSKEMMLLDMQNETKFSCAYVCLSKEQQHSKCSYFP